MPPLAMSRAIPGRIFAAAGRRVLDLAFPPVCLSCETGTGSAAALCPACWRAMPFITQPCCDRLGVPFAFDGGAGMVSPAALTDPPAFGRARAVARYDGPARDLVHRLKYGDRLELAPAMGRWMAGAGVELLRGAPLLVPVPLHRWRLWRRRHNQAAVLARAVAAASGCALAPTVLRRRKATSPQVGLSRNERASNLRGAFVVAPGHRGQLAGRRVVLVDDVLTTGATANAAARVLLGAGASAVDVLTFALVCPPT